MSATCRNCGLSLDPDDAFCGNCGQAASVAVARASDGGELAIGEAAASSGPPEDDARIGAAETAWRPRASSREADSVTEPEFGQGRSDDAGRTAYQAQGQTRYSPGHGQGAGHPEQVRTGYSIQSQATASSKGFIGSLFDFGFNSFVTPTVVKVLYVLIMIVLGLTGLGFAVGAFALNKVLGIFVLIVVAPLMFLIFLALYRIMLEFFIVIFRIAEDLRAIRDRSGSG